MAAEGKDDVHDGAEGRDKADGSGRVDGWVWFWDSDADHGDHDGGEDRDEGEDGEVGDVLEGAWEGEHEEQDEADYAPDDGACGMAGDGIHGDRPG